jgi:putative transposase
MASAAKLGWSMANSLQAELVLDALEMACWQRRPSQVMHRSDQGAQYPLFAFGHR